MKHARRVLPLLLAPLFACAPLRPAPPSEAQLLEQARALHERIVVLDTHVDIAGTSYATAELDPGLEQPRLRCDLVKMERGAVDAVFLAVFTGQRGGLDEEGYAKVLERARSLFDAIHRLPRMHPDRCALVRSTAELEQVLASGRRAILIGIENGYPVGEDLARLREFHDLGARYITLSHSDHNQICDSSSAEQPLHHGLSAYGEEVVAEMNRLGIMVDVSHVAESTFWDVMELSEAPVIASHSGCAALRAHHRNLTDRQLEALAANGGSIQIVALGSYLKAESEERRAAIEALRAEVGLPSAEERRAMSDEQREALAPKYEAYRARRRELDQVMPVATLADFVDHVEHAVAVAGIDHVGIGTDFDGGGGIAGFQTHAEAHAVTVELLRRGFSEEDIEKIWGGNLLRVWREVEETAERLKELDSAYLDLVRRRREHQKAQEIDQALAAYEAAFELRPADIELLMDSAIPLGELGRRDEELAVHQRILELQPGNPRAHYFRGRCLEDLGRVEDALAAFERALQIHPEHEGAAEARERLLSERGKD